jgi:hypothetical protein
MEPMQKLAFVDRWGASDRPFWEGYGVAKIAIVFADPSKFPPPLSLASSSLITLYYVDYKGASKGRM